MPLNKLIPLIFLLIPIASFCQPDEKEFKAILTLQKIGKAYRSGSPIDTAWRTYLGVITDSNNRVKYHVVKEFYKLQAGSTWHGHSSIYFFDVKKKLKATYDAGMPADLPFKIVHNTFYFHYDDNGLIKTYTQHVMIPLEKWFCTAPSGCDVINFIE
jgi:hypothetical protein